MKRFNSIYIFILAIFFVGISCSKDKGNYEYSQINRLTIVNEEGDDITNSTFNVRFGRDLVIKPKISGDLIINSQQDVQCYWILDNDTISTEEELIINTSLLGIGEKIGKLVVVDKTTSLSTSIPFLVKITASISKGAFILTQNENDETILVLKDTNRAEDYMYITDINGISLGKKPSSVEVTYKWAGRGNDYLRMMIATEEGDYPMIEFDLNQMIPTRLYDKYGSLIGGGVFSPNFISSDQSLLMSNKFLGHTLINGKVHRYTTGIIGRDVAENFDYSFNRNGFYPSEVTPGSFLAGFDEKSESIRLFGNNSSANFEYFMEFENKFDNQKTKGHRVVAIKEIFGDDGIWYWQFITRAGSNILMQNGIMNYEVFPYILDNVNTVAQKNVPEIVDGVDFVLSADFWYFAKGRTIYQFSTKGLDIIPYLTLPNDGSGDIVSWKFDINYGEDYQKIAIATYDPTSKEKFKGSYYLYDIVSRKFDTADRNVIDKAVDMRLGL